MSIDPNQPFKDGEWEQFVAKLTEQADALAQDGKQDASGILREAIQQSHLLAPYGTLEEVRLGMIEIILLCSGANYGAAHEVQTALGKAVMAYRQSALPEGASAAAGGAAMIQDQVYDRFVAIANLVTNGREPSAYFTDGQAKPKLPNKADKEPVREIYNDLVSATNNSRSITTKQITDAVNRKPMSRAEMNTLRDLKGSRPDSWVEQQIAVIRARRAEILLGCFRGAQISKNPEFARPDMSPESNLRRGASNHAWQPGDAYTQGGWRGRH